MIAGWFIVGEKYCPSPALVGAGTGNINHSYPSIMHTFSGVGNHTPVQVRGMPGPGTQ